MRPAASSPTVRGRVLRRIATAGTAAFLTVAFVSGCSGATDPDDAAEPTPTATEAGPRPTPSTVAGPTPVGTILPGECEDIYGPDMFAGLQEDIPPLNDPSMTDPNFSNVDELEELVRSVEYLQCTWGGAGEMGIVTAVAKVSEEQSTEAQTIMESSGFDCYQQLQGTRCVNRDELEGSTVGESHFLRDDVWLSTLWVNAPIRGYTENMVNAIWG